MTNRQPTRSTQAAEQAAQDILILSRNTLLVHLRFLDAALSQLTLYADPEVPLATDGQHIYYQFAHVIRQYRLQPSSVTRDYLHMALHCIMHHPFIGEQVDQSCWNLAADIAVEAIIDELDLPCTASPRQRDQSDLLASLRHELKTLTAEALYRYYREKHLPDEALHALRAPFMADEHRDWFRITHESDEKEQPDDGESGSQQNGNQDGGGQDGESDEGEQDGSGKESPGDAPDDAKERMQAACAQSETHKAWQEISRQLETNLNTFSHKWGDKSGLLSAAVQAANRERFDYAEFLRRFAEMSETVMINDEEFDYIFYTYGLSLYRNLPLVEPLEYKEMQRVREFVIAIDTSASVQGDLIQRFVGRTLDILSAQQTFDERIDLYIIQCDADVKEAVRLTSSEAIETYCSGMTLQGFGGTDFRPVFHYVAELQSKGNLTHLKGLLYFTDGDGDYPQTPPPYEVAFLFPDTANTQSKVPSWAMRLTLNLDEF